jgi:flagellar biogenesis protein FliO
MGGHNSEQRDTGVYMRDFIAIEMVVLLVIFIPAIWALRKFLIKNTKA